MKVTQALVPAVLVLGLFGAGCRASVRVTARTPRPPTKVVVKTTTTTTTTTAKVRVVFKEPPPLVEVEDDIYVVQDNDAAIYYIDDHYWYYDDGNWYRATAWDGQFAVVEVKVVPTVIVKRDHSRYVRYRAGSGVVVRRDTEVREIRRKRRATPTETRRTRVVFREAPPLVEVEDDIYIVHDNDVAVYYIDDNYWYYDDGVWYRASAWDGSFVVVEVKVVPTVIVKRDHSRYVRYRGDKKIVVRRDTEVREIRKKRRKTR